MNTNLLLSAKINPGLVPEPTVYRSKSYFKERLSEFFTSEGLFFARVRGKAKPCKHKATKLHA